MDSATQFIISLFFGLFVGITAGIALANMKSPWWVTAFAVIAVVIVFGWLATKFWSLFDSRRRGRGNDG